MIDSIRRRLNSSPKDPWATDLAFEPDFSEVSELPLGRTILLAAAGVHSHEPSNDVHLKDYYKGLISVAINQGGNYRGQHIAVPWLRLTLAGLEMRPLPPEAMWEGELEDNAIDRPGYQDLFPEENTPK